MRDIENNRVVVAKGDGLRKGWRGKGIEPRSPALQADSLPSEPPGKLITISFISS